MNIYNKLINDCRFSKDEMTCINTDIIKCEDFHNLIANESRKITAYNAYAVNSKFEKFIQKNVIQNVIFHPPATIVFWNDGTKTVVKTQNGEPFDPEKGLAMAILKRIRSEKGHYYKEIKKWCHTYRDNNP